MPSCLYEMSPQQPFYLLCVATLTLLFSGQVRGARRKLRLHPSGLHLPCTRINAAMLTLASKAMLTYQSHLSIDVLLPAQH